MTLAFTFPGQGSQSIGMLAGLAADYAQVEDCFAEASEVLGYELWELAQQGPEARLNATEQTQPAMLAAGVAVARVWAAAGGPALAWLGLLLVLIGLNSTNTRADDIADCNQTTDIELRLQACTSLLRTCMVSWNVISARCKAIIASCSLAPPSQATAIVGEFLAPSELTPSPSEML